MRTYVVTMIVYLYDDEIHDEYHEWKNQRDVIAKAGATLDEFNNGGATFSRDGYAEYNMSVVERLKERTEKL